MPLNHGGGVDKWLNPIFIPHPPLWVQEAAATATALVEAGCLLPVVRGPCVAGYTLAGWFPSPLACLPSSPLPSPPPHSLTHPHPHNPGYASQEAAAHSLHNGFFRDSRLWLYIYGGHKDARDQHRRSPSLGGEELALLDQVSGVDRLMVDMCGCTGTRRGGGLVKPARMCMCIQIHTHTCTKQRTHA